MFGLYLPQSKSKSQFLCSLLHLNNNTDKLSILHMCSVVVVDNCVPEILPFNFFFNIMFLAKIRKIILIFVFIEFSPSSWWSQRLGAGWGIEEQINRVWIKVEFHHICHLLYLFSLFGSLICDLIKDWKGFYRLLQDAQLTAIAFDACFRLIWENWIIT